MAAKIQKDSKGFYTSAWGEARFYVASEDTDTFEAYCKSVNKNSRDVLKSLIDTNLSLPEILKKGRSIIAMEKAAKNPKAQKPTVSADNGGLTPVPVEQVGTVTLDSTGSTGNLDPTPGGSTPENAPEVGVNSVQPVTAAKVKAKKGVGAKPEVVSQPPTELPTHVKEGSETPADKVRQVSTEEFRKLMLAGKKS